MEEVLWAVTAKQRDGVSCSNEQQPSSREAFGPLQDTRQHWCLAGRSSWAIRPWRQSGTLVCLLDFDPVPEDSPRRPVLYMTKIIFFLGLELFVLGYIHICLFWLPFRLWWENPGVFTEAQRASLSQTSLARIICDNTNITEVPRQPFLYRPRGSGYTHCSDIPVFNLNPWKEGEFVWKNFCLTWFDEFLSIICPF